MCLYLKVNIEIVSYGELPSSVAINLLFAFTIIVIDGKILHLVVNIMI